MTKLTRRQFTAAVAAVALDPVGVYRAVARRRALRAAPVEQHLVPGLRVVRDQGVTVIVPPLHHRVVTAKVTADVTREAREELEHALAGLERDYPLSPAG